MPYIPEEIGHCNEQELHLVFAVPSVDVLELVFDNLLGPVQLEQVSILLLDILATLFLSQLFWRRRKNFINTKVAPLLHNSSETDVQQACNCCVLQLAWQPFCNASWQHMQFPLFKSCQLFCFPKYKEVTFGHTRYSDIYVMQ